MQIMGKDIGVRDIIAAAVRWISGSNAAEVCAAERQYRKKSLAHKKAPAVQQWLLYKKRHRPTLPPVTAIPSALAGLTALFGMGRGRHRRYRHLKCFY